MRLARQLGMRREGIRELSRLAGIRPPRLADLLQPGIRIERRLRIVHGARVFASDDLRRHARTKNHLGKRGFGDLARPPDAFLGLVQFCESDIGP